MTALRFKHALLTDFVWCPPPFTIPLSSLPLHSVNAVFHAHSPRSHLPVRHSGQNLRPCAWWWGRYCPSQDRNGKDFLLRHSINREAPEWVWNCCQGPCSKGTHPAPGLAQFMNDFSIYWPLSEYVYLRLGAGADPNQRVGNPGLQRLQRHRQEPQCYLFLWRQFLQPTEWVQTHIHSWRDSEIKSTNICNFSCTHLIVLFLYWFISFSLSH